MSFSDSFARVAKWTAHASGRPATFAIAFAVILVWAISGPMFHYSDTWQLVINTGTTVVTFLMVFLIQNTQNRDATAMQIKLDELIRAVQGAHNAVVSMEDAEEQELVQTKARYDELAARARARAGSGEEDTDSPELIAEVAAARSEAAAAKGKATDAKREAQAAKAEAKKKPG